MRYPEMERSILYRLDARTKMLFLLMYIILGVTVLDPALILFLLLIAGLMYRLGRIPLRVLLGLTKPLMAAFVLFFVLNFPFAQPRPGETALFYLIPPGHIPVTVTGVLTGLANAMRFVMFIWMANLMTLLTPTSDLLLAMARGGFPPEATIAISIAFAYIPVLENEFRTIIEAQRSRAARFEYRNPFKRAMAYIPVIVPALFVSVMRGRDIARAIESRGFTYNPRCRTYRKTIRMQPRDYILLGLMVSVIAVAGYLRYGCGWLDYRFTYELLFGK